MIVGDGNGGAAVAPGWKRARLSLGHLSKGAHTLVLGGHNNQKTLRKESTELRIDDVEVSVEDAADSRIGAKAVVAQLSFARFKENVRMLASFGDRRQESQSYKNADAWLAKQLTADYKVERNNHTYFDQPRDQIYMTKAGHESPDRMFLITAHFDGRGGSGAAEDDGSGSSLVLEAARAFAARGIRTDFSVRFVFLNNEETGLNGSSASCSTT